MKYLRITEYNYCKTIYEINKFLDNEDKVFGEEEYDISGYFFKKSPTFDDDIIKNNLGR